MLLAQRAPVRSTASNKLLQYVAEISFLLPDAQAEFKLTYSTGDKRRYHCGMPAAIAAVNLTEAEKLEKWQEILARLSSFTESSQRFVTGVLADFARLATPL